MGATGIGSFENDDATQWLARLAQRKDLSIFDNAFAADPDRAFIDAPTGRVIQAAGEIVAAAIGRGGPELPAEAQEWISKHKDLDFGRVRQPARALVNALLSPRSELHDLWEEAGEPFEPWHASIADLVERLA